MLLCTIAALLFSGEWLALQAEGFLWRSLPWLADWKVGSLPFYAACLVALLAVSFSAGRKLRSPWWPGRWEGGGFLGLICALLLGPLGLASLFRSGLSHWHAPDSGLAFVSGVVLAPLVEEWAFRGILFRASLWATGPWRWAPPAAMAFTALLFGFWHLPFVRGAVSPVEMVLANFAFGMCLAFARFRLNALGPGALVHALGNAFYLLTA